MENLLFSGVPIPKHVTVIGVCSFVAIGCFHRLFVLLKFIFYDTFSFSLVLVLIVYDGFSFSLFSYFIYILFHLVCISIFFCLFLYYL